VRAALFIGVFLWGKLVFGTGGMGSQVGISIRLRVDFGEGSLRGSLTVQRQGIFHQLQSQPFSNLSLDNELFRVSPVIWQHLPHTHVDLNINNPEKSQQNTFVIIISEFI
jgi:hypothetical protein